MLLKIEYQLHIQGGKCQIPTRCGIPGRWNKFQCDRGRSKNLILPVGEPRHWRRVVWATHPVRACRRRVVWTTHPVLASWFRGGPPLGANCRFSYMSCSATALSRCAVNHSQTINSSAVAWSRMYCREGVATGHSAFAKLCPHDQDSNVDWLVTNAGYE